MIERGLRLRWLCDGTDRLDWDDLLAVVAQLPRDSAVGRFELGEQAQWGLGESLTAELVDSLRVVQWLMGRYMGADVEFPPMVPRPWEAEGAGGVSGEVVDAEVVNPMGEDEPGRFVGETLSVAEMAEFLGWA